MLRDPQSHDEQVARDRAAGCPCHEYGDDGTRNHTTPSGKFFMLKDYLDAKPFTVCNNHLSAYCAENGFEEVAIA